MLLVAFVVFVLWRAVVWRRQGFTIVRELAVAALFGWSLATVRLTFFPLIIIYYDWHGSSNWIPLASILQLVRDTSAPVAIYNIVGNLALFVPLGLLLPVLFQRLRSPLPVLWRAGAISALIEGTQYITRARAVDVDDIILNTAGAMVGFGLYVIGAAAIGRWQGGRKLLDTVGSMSRREPLLHGIVPLVVTMGIVVPMMVSTVVGQTLAAGEDGIVGVALSDWPDGSVVARTVVDDHTFLVVAGASSRPGELGLSSFKQVLPGRYTWLSSGVLDQQAGTRFGHSITAYDPTTGERPILVVWGANNDSKSALRVSGNGVNETFGVGSDYFVVGVAFEDDPTQAVLDEFEFLFTDDQSTPTPVAGAQTDQ